MLATIEFNDQPLRKADEVSDVEIDRCLSPKLVASEAVRTHDLPEAMLGVGRVRAHFLGPGAQL
jgi:hypothetical protein